MADELKVGLRHFDVDAVEKLLQRHYNVALAIGDTKEPERIHISGWLNFVSLANELNVLAAPSTPSAGLCPKCGGPIKSGSHGDWCPKPTCKWGWETEMDGSHLQPPQPAELAELRALVEKWSGRATYYSALSSAQAINTDAAYFEAKPRCYKECADELTAAIDRAEKAGGKEKGNERLGTNS